MNHFIYFFEFIWLIFTIINPWKRLSNILFSLFSNILFWISDLHIGFLIFNLHNALLCQRTTCIRTKHWLKHHVEFISTFVKTNIINVTVQFAQGTDTIWSPSSETINQSFTLFMKVKCNYSVDSFIILWITSTFGFCSYYYNCCDVLYFKHFLQLNWLNKVITVQLIIFLNHQSVQGQFSAQYSGEKLMCGGSTSKITTNFKFVCDKNAFWNNTNDLYHGGAKVYPTNLHNSTFNNQTCEVY